MSEEFYRTIDINEGVISTAKNYWAPSGDGGKMVQKGIGAVHDAAKTTKKFYSPSGEGGKTIQKGMETTGRFWNKAYKEGVPSAVKDAGNSAAGDTARKAAEAAKKIEGTKAIRDAAKEESGKLVNRLQAGASKAYGVAKQAVQDHPGVAGAVAGAGGAVAAGLAAKKLRDKMKAKASQ